MKNKRQLVSVYSDGMVYIFEDGLIAYLDNFHIGEFATLLQWVDLQSLKPESTTVL